MSSLSRSFFFLWFFSTAIFFWCPSGEGYRRSPIPEEEMGAWGFLNTKGEWILTPRFNSAGQFSEGLAAVISGPNPENHRRVYVDIRGKKISTSDFSLALPFSDGLALVDQRVEIPGKPYRDRPALMDAHGNFPFDFARSQNVKEGVFIADLDGEKNYWVIRKDGEKLFQLKGTPSQFEFSEGLIPLVRGNEVNYLNTSGVVVAKMSGYFAGGFHEGRASFNQTDERFGGTWGFIDRTGRICVLPKYSSVSDFHYGLAVFHDSKSHTYGILDRSGHELLKTKWLLHEFSEGLGGFRDLQAPHERSCGFINNRGKVQIPAKFEYIGNFSDGLCPAAVREKDQTYWGFIDKNGDWIIKPIFLKAENFSNGLAAVCVLRSKK